MVQQRLAISIPNINSSRTATAMNSPAAADDADIELFVETPLHELRSNTRLQLSQLLNCRKILRSEDGYERDWRGVAELAAVRSFCNTFSDDPMTSVLREWCAHNTQTATFAHLQHYLGTIDRWDVCDDIYENMVEDAKKYAAKLRQKSLTLADGAEALPSGTDTSTAVVTTGSSGRDNDFSVLTRDDVILAQKGLPPQQYDAFVLFADADIEQAAEIQTKFEENEKFNFKLCFKNRDLLGGVPFPHKALSELIEQRCRYLLVILTTEFLKSPENTFLVDYTHELQIRNNTRKIIPLIYEDSDVLPRTLKMYTYLKYSPVSNGLFDFWSRLADSIRRPYSATDMVPTYGNTDVDNVPCRQISSDTGYASLPSPRTPSPTSPIPSININGHAYIPEHELVQKKDRHQFIKHTTLRQNSTNSNKLAQVNGFALRNAHSTSQLNAGCAPNSKSNNNNNNNVSMCDLSITGETKKKKKKPIKGVLKRVFSRSSPKLQAAAE